MSIDIFNKIAKARTLRDLHGATYDYFIASSENPVIELKGAAKEEICGVLTDRALLHLNAAPMFNAPQILQQINNCRKGIRCNPYSETGTDEHHLPDQHRLHTYLVGRVQNEIAQSRDGCMINATLKTLNTSLDMIGTRLSTDEKQSLAQIVFDTPSDGQWKECNLRYLGLSSGDMKAAPALAA